MSQEAEIKKAITHYKQAKFELTPLEGKKPILKNWTKRAIPATQYFQILNKGYNFGAILTAKHLVIDVDPRNFTDSNTWNRFVKLYDLKPLLTKTPIVKTGGGGFHIYMRKPKHINIIETIDGFEGIEFKSKNRQVVIPGSIHPESKQPYLWYKNASNLFNLPNTPDNILKIIARPHVGTDAFSLAGQFSIEEIDKILSVLNVEEYRDHDDWLRIMMACHHASAGHARQEFINWSINDPKYKNDDHKIGRRWDSLHFAIDNNITYRTLRYELKKINKLDVITDLYSNEHDLPTQVSVELGFIQADSTEQMGPFEYLNNKYCSVMLSTKTVLYHFRESDPTQWATTSKQSFEQQYGGLTVEPKGAKKPIPLVKAWYKWRHHRKAAEAVMDIEGKFSNNLQILNLWRGWSLKPNGDPTLSWDYLDTLLEHGLANGNKDYYDYILNWTAFMFQYPEKLAEVALVFTGKKGTGKSTYGKVLDYIVGETHSIHVTSPDVFVGRFNSHLENKVFIFADEAVSPTSDAQNSRLKAMITEKNATVEGKGIEARRVRNYIHLIIASNNPSPVLVSPDERRYAMFEVSDAFRRDIDFFSKLHHQMENGGYEKFMFDMMMRPLNDWNPRDTIPDTVTLADQKLAAMDSIEEWWVHVLNYETRQPSNISLNKMDISNMSDDQISILRHKYDWSIYPCRVFRDELRILYIDFINEEKSGYNKYTNRTARFFWKKMREIANVPSITEKQPFRDCIKYTDHDMQMRLNPMKEVSIEERALSVEIPSILECRELMDKRYGESFNWIDIPENE